MKFVQSLSERFECSLERAFAAPIRGDATRYLSGYRLQPGIIGFEDDAHWGQPGGVRYPITNGNWCVPAGRLLTDTTLERVENEQWTWEITNFRAASMFFVERAVARWRTTQVADRAIEVQYTYEYFPSRSVYAPLVYFLLVLQVRGMMRQTLQEIKRFAESDEPFLYD